MVDPNRKINNRLSEDDAAFLVEIEQAFRNRYTEADKEFAAFTAKPNRTPPVVEPWQTKRHHHGDSSGQRNWNRNNYRPNNRNQGNHYRSQRNYRPYDRNFRRDADNVGGSHGSY